MKRSRPLAENELARLTILGAAGEVTGSCYLLETHRSRVLFECGLFQGGRQAASKNRRPFPFEHRRLDAVVLTHAHIDHTGLVPKLVAEGYGRRIHATGPTCDLLRIMWPDAAHIQEHDTRRATRRSLRRGGRPVEPLYTGADAERALRCLERAPFDELVAVTHDVQVRFKRAGHILGASSVEVLIEDAGVTRRLVLSGDVGRASEPLLLDPEPPTEADVVLLESTYGDRDHRDLEATLTELAEVLDHAGRAGANVIVPVFAVGRAQEILYYLGLFEREGRIQPRPVYLDSPMAIAVTELYDGRAECFRAPVRELLEAGKDELEPRMLRFCRTPEESMALNEKRGIVILAASGMCEAGRVVHHLRHNLWREGTHVVIVGYQAEGTTGRALVDGASKVRIFGESIAVRAGVHTVGGFSAHAGQTALCSWVRPMLAGGARLALVHGEDDKRAALEAKLRDRAQGKIFVPGPGAAISLRRRGEPVVWEQTANP